MQSTTMKHRTVTALFHNRADANRAIEELVGAGYRAPLSGSRQRRMYLRPTKQERHHTMNPR